MTKTTEQTAGVTAGDNLRVDVCDGKYTVIQLDNGSMKFMRNGEPWPAADESFAHVGLILGLAQEVRSLRSFANAFTNLATAHHCDPAKLAIELDLVKLVKELRSARDMIAIPANKFMAKYQLDHEEVSEWIDDARQRIDELLFPLSKADAGRTAP